jgi:ATP-dependent Clp protease ATP-binding subunit ClpC
VFERFTESARKSVVLAQEEARSLDHDYIGTEHLLLGLLREGEGVGARALAWLNVSLDATRSRVEAKIGRGKNAPTGHIPFTARAKKVLELSLRESRILSQDHIGTEHLLLALVAEQEGIAAVVLNGLGATEEQVRAVVLAILEKRELPGPPTVRVRPMTPSEFEAYAAWSVDEYAKDLERSGRASAEVAKARAEQAFASLLPDGIDTANQVFLVGEDGETGEHVGLLWFGPSTDDRAVAWLYDITVDEEVRGRGYGRALMLRFEEEAGARGYARAGLNVFGDNAVARGLYESLGYRESARQLHKDLSGGET